MLDRERLAKVLAMTTSNHDGEALSAIRKANDILAGENLTWNELLGQPLRSVHVSVTRYPATSARYEPSEEWISPHLKDKVTLDLMFRTILEKLPAGVEFREFIESVHGWYQKHGSVTPKMYNALRQAYTRASR